MEVKRFREEADIGDLVLFANGECTAIGFVMKIEDKYAMLSNREARRTDGTPRKPGFFRTYKDEKQWKEPYKYWEDYLILIKNPYAGAIIFTAED